MATIPAPLPRFNLACVLIAAILASSMAFIDSTALNVALPILQSDLRMSGSDMLWTVNAYALFLSALILVGGALGDRYGRKRVFMLGIILFTSASVVCGLAQSPGVLVTARAVQGIGGALMTPGSLALVSALFPAEQRGSAIGLWSTFSTVTTLGGPLLGGWLAGQGLWRVIFFINVPLAAIALLLLVIGVPENRDTNSPRNLDYLGAALVTLGLAGLTFGFTEAPTLGFGSPLILLALGGGSVALIAFVYSQARGAHPMMPLGLFRSRTFSGANALTLFLYAALGAVPFFLSLNLVQIQDYPPQDAGAVLLPLGIILALMSFASGRLSDRVGPRRMLTVGPALCGVGFLLFALPGLTNGPADYWTTYFPAAVLLGIGLGVTVAPLTAAVMGAAPAQSSGIASGINNTVARTASVLAIAILGALALTLFSGGLATRAAALNLAPETLQALQAEASKLADAQVPAGLVGAEAADVRAAIQWAYIDTFRLIALICAGLAWLSSALAWALVDGKRSSRA